MPVDCPYVPFSCPHPHCDDPVLSLTAEILDLLAQESLAEPPSAAECSLYADAMSTHFSRQFQGDATHAATVLSIVVVESFLTGRRLPRSATLRDVRVLVMGVIGRLQCFSPATAGLVLEVLAQFWRFLADLWPVSSLQPILSYLAHPQTTDALRQRLAKTAHEPSGRNQPTAAEASREMEGQGPRPETTPPQDAAA